MLNRTIKKLFGNKNRNSSGNITILYGSHTGNSSYIAKEVHAYLKSNGLASTVKNMARYKVNKLIDEQFILLIVSTHGEGDPPPSINKFYKELFSAEAPRLRQLRYSVCALGDSSYDFFCQTGKDIDQRLQELGASRLTKRVDCDVEFHGKVASWISLIPVQCQSDKDKEIKSLKLEDLRDPGTFQARIKKQCLLSDAGTYHVELSVNEKSLAYSPGDSVSIIPQNPEPLVRLIIQQLNGDSTTEGIDEEKNQMLYHLLLRQVEITKLNQLMVENYQSLIQNKALGKLIANSKEFRFYIKNHDLLDLMLDFPYHGDVDPFVSILQKIRPRLYSISSSLKQHPNEIHLIIRLIQSELKGRLRTGSCSSYLNRYLKIGDQVDIQLMPNEQFRLPEDESPVIMIATGTGIAPFRAFLEESEQLSATRKYWLIFGEKFSHRDFYYRNEWKNRMRNGCLERLDTAFSRNQSQKIYVQHKIQEHANEFFSWLEDGAHLYICGSIQMGRDVKKTINQIIGEVGNMSGNAASAYMDKLLEAGKIHEDVY